MAGIQGHSSTERVVGVRYTGLAPMIVRAINPTLEEMKALNINAQKEPEYITEEFVEAKDGLPASNYTKNRLDVHLFYAPVNLASKVTFWLESRVRYNKDRTKVEWIDKFGNTGWSPDEETVPDVTWLDKATARPALVGEAKMVVMIRAWANTGPKDQAVLDNPIALVQGDYTEIKAAHRHLMKNEVLALNGIRTVDINGKQAQFQAVYDGYFDRPYRKDFNAWRKALSNQYAKFDADYQDDLNFREYTGSSAVASDKPSNLNLPEGAQQGQQEYKF